jgi:serine/threonine-protein kinase
LGRYALYGEVASGGMATVHLGRLLGPVGFSRTVAIKRLHPQFAKDPQFVAMFLDEARLAARIRHPNVIPTLDVVAVAGEVFLVMEYVHGESLSQLVRATKAQGERIPLPIAAHVMAGVLHGLHAAHEARNERGEPLGIVHRDVSPQNVLVGTDGVARVLDFGVAKAVGRLVSTDDGAIKGKLAYMAPEQVRGQPVTARTDVFAAAIVLWEIITGRRLFAGDNAGESVHQVLEAAVDPPSRWAPGVPAALDTVVMRGLERDPAARFASAKEMAVALERSLGLVSPREVGEWVEQIASERLGHRARLVAEVEHLSSDPGILGAGPPADEAPTNSIGGAPSAADEDKTSVATAGPSRASSAGSQGRLLALAAVLSAIVSIAGAAIIFVVVGGVPAPAPTGADTGAARPEQPPPGSTAAGSAAVVRAPEPRPPVPSGTGAASAEAPLASAAPRASSSGSAASRPGAPPRSDPSARKTPLYSRD